MNVRLSSTFPVGALVLVAQLALAGCVWRFGPSDPVPLHYGFSGAADRFGGRGEAAGLVAGVALIGALGWLVLEAMRQGSERPRGYAAAQMVLLIAVGFVGALQAVHVFGPGLGVDVSSPAFHMAALGVMFAAVGAFLGKVPPNPLVGVRTYWSLNSRLAWDKSNRLGGRLMFWIGVIGLLAAPFTPEPLGFQTLIAAILFAAVASVFQSWRVWRSDPERNSL